MRDLLSTFDKANLVKSLDIGRKSSVDAEDLSFDDGSSAEEIEDFCAVLPGVGVSVFAHALVVVTVDLGDLSGLVVTSEEGDVSGVPHLQAHQKLECLNRVESTVYEISHEDVASLGNVTSLVEEFK